ncbi:Holliday junction resolvase RecU [Levilactobacillus brevis]|uniref:Holliday junction resolvase RecU n=1 Tax=Levilactobacillus brevis TaxID=1580 RepID=UPI003D17361D
MYRAQDLFTFWDAQQQGGRKSIPYATIAQDGIQIPAELQLPVPYLKAVDQLLS